MKLLEGEELIETDDLKYSHMCAEIIYNCTCFHAYHYKGGYLINRKVQQAGECEEITSQVIISVEDYEALEDDYLSEMVLFQSVSDLFYPGDGDYYEECTSRGWR